MLKNLPAANISNQAKAKCGEIFCHSSTDFTIYCTFCDMKAFTYEDFLLHVQNVHFENNILKTETFHTECNQYLEVKIKNEVIVDKMDQLHEEEALWDNLNQSYDNGLDDISSHEEEELVSVLNKTKKTLRERLPITSKRHNDNESDDYDYGHSSDEDYKPILNEKISADLDKKPHRCDHCGKSYKTPGLLKSHITRGHKEKTDEKLVKKEKVDKEQPCPECEQKFHSKKLLDQHVLEIHDGYKCSICDKRFRARRQHQIHVGIHNSGRNCVCDFENCGKAFHTRKRLANHKKIHTEPKNLICDTCGYTCRENETLRVHQRTHTGERPFVCKVCNKGFISSSSLSEHMASHSNIRPHVCKVCNASFARRKALYHHSFLHMDVRKFKCKICGSAYKQASALAGHMRKHREEGMMSMLPEQVVEEPLPLTTPLAVPPSYHPFLTF